MCRHPRNHAAGKPTQRLGGQGNRSISTDDGQPSSIPSRTHDDVNEVLVYNSKRKEGGRQIGQSAG